MKIGFIGCGNMASALISGILNAGVCKSDAIYISDADREKTFQFSKQGVHVCETNAEVAENSDAVILAVKPNVYETVLNHLAGCRKLIISIAPGISIKYMQGLLGAEAKIIRTMPNTPCMVGEGMTALAASEGVGEADLRLARSIFEAAGKVEQFPESMMDAVVALNGSSPAYFYMFIDAMAKGAAKEGFSYETAVKMAAQTALGAAKMVLLGKDTPEILIQKVCSPGGTTIEAVEYFRENGLYGLVEQAMDKCTDKAKKLSK